MGSNACFIFFMSPSFPFQIQDSFALHVHGRSSISLCLILYLCGENWYCVVLELK